MRRESPSCVRVTAPMVPMGSLPALCSSQPSTDRLVLDGIDRDEARLFWLALSSVHSQIHRTVTTKLFELVYSASVAQMHGAWFAGRHWHHTGWIAMMGRKTKVGWSFCVLRLILAFGYGDALTLSSLIWFLYRWNAPRNFCILPLILAFGSGDALTSLKLVWFLFVDSSQTTK